MNSSLSSWVRAVAISALVTAVMLAVLIIAAEEIPVLKDWLKATFTHHWLGKGALGLMLFVVVSFGARMWGGGAQLSKIIFVEALIAFLSAAAITLFFLLHALKLV